MTEVLKSLAGLGYPYDFWRGPQAVRSEEDAELGINCVTLAHMALARVGVQLPPELHANEMFLDMRDTGRHVTPVAGGPRLWRPGDVVFFGVNRPDWVAEEFVPQYSQDGHGDLINWTASPIRHVAVVADTMPEGNPALLHTSHRAGIEVTTLDGIMDTERHEKIWGVGRPTALSKTEI